MFCNTDHYRYCDNLHCADATLIDVYIVLSYIMWLHHHIKIHERGLQTFFLEEMEGDMFFGRNIYPCIYRSFPYPPSPPHQMKSTNFSTYMLCTKNTCTIFNPGHAEPTRLPFFTQPEASPPGEQFLFSSTYSHKSSPSWKRWFVMSLDEGGGGGGKPNCIIPPRHHSLPNSADCPTHTSTLWLAHKHTQTTHTHTHHAKTHTNTSLS